MTLSVTYKTRHEAGSCMACNSELHFKVWSIKTKQNEFRFCNACMKKIKQLAK